MFGNWLQRWLKRKPRPIIRRSPSRPRLEVLEDRTLLSASLVDDINVRTASSAPKDLVNFNGSLYFVAKDNANQTDLWKNTANGPTAVKTLPPLSPNPSAVGNMTVVGNHLFFTLEDTDYNTELWSSDGTADGTKLLHTFSFLAAGPTPAIGFNGDLYFVANDGTQYAQMWKSDGDSVTAIDTGAITPTQSTQQLTVGNGELYFTAFAYDSNGQFEEKIGETDGTNTQALNLGSTIFAQFKGLTVVNGNLDFFGRAYTDSYPSDPYYLYQYSAGAMSQIGSTAFNSYGDVETAVVNNELFFSAAPSTSYSNQLWVVNASGIQQLQPSNPPPDFYPGNLHSLNGLLVFGNEFGESLWTSDGTSAGTKELAPKGAIGLNANESVEYNNYLYYEVQAGPSVQFWRTDGQSTQLVYDFGAGSEANYHAFEPTVVGNIIYLSGYDPLHGVELWQSDGQPNSTATSLVADLNTDTLDSDPTNLTDVNGTLYFTVDTGPLPGRGLDDVELWKSNSGGTSAVPGAPAALGQFDLTNVNGTLFYISVDSHTGHSQLWKTDGTTTTEIMDFGDANLNSVNQLIAVGNTLYVEAYGNNGGELWAFDKDASVAPASPLATNLGFGYGQDLAAAFNGKLYFLNRVYDPSTYTSTSQLWVSDGTAAGTQRANMGNPDNSPEYLTASNGTLSFFDFDSTSGNLQLWQSTNGTTATMTADLNALTASSDYLAVYSPINANGTLYFTVVDRSNYSVKPTLWKSNADGVEQLASLPSANSNSRLVATVGNSLFFVAYGSDGQELWTSDGTVAGTRMVQAFRGILSLTSFDGKVFLDANDGTHGYELWESDGTTAGTYLVHDFVPGTGFAGYGSPTASGGRLYFSAEDVAHGVELWAFDPATHFQISVSSGVPLAGVPFTVTVKALDQFGNVDTDFQGSVHFSSSDGSIDFDRVFTAGDATADNGVYTFTATLPAGTQTLSASGSIAGNLTMTVPADVSSQIGIQRTGVVYNRATRLFSGQIILTNNVGALNAPVDLLLQGLTPGVQLQAAAAVIDGVTYNLSIQTDGDGDPVLLIPADVLGILQGGQALRITVQFYNPSHKLMDFTPRTFADE